MNTAADSIFKMLGDQNRLRIVVMLLNRRLCVGHMVNALSMHQATLSKQLGLLKSSGILSTRKHKQRVYYFVSQLFLESHPHLVSELAALSQQPSFASDSDKLQATHHCSCDDECLCIL